MKIQICIVLLLNSDVILYLLQDFAHISMFVFMVLIQKKVLLCLIYLLILDLALHTFEKKCQDQSKCGNGLVKCMITKSLMDWFYVKFSPLLGVP